jgi:Zn-dependent protease/predicted transcriptional regulator
MKNSLKLFAVRGVDIRLHFTFPLILLYAALQFGLIGGAAGALFGVVAVLLLFALVTLHELGHSFAAQQYGIQVRQIVLSPLGGVAQLAEMPDKPAQELVIAAAGPAVNFVVAAVTGVVYLALGKGLPGLDAFQPWQTGFGLSSLFGYLFVTNLLLAAFNLLPAFPMDGGRILRALLALRLDYVRATALAAGIGRVAAVGIGLYGLWTGGLFLMLIAYFIFTAAGAELRYTRYRRAVQGYTVQHVYSASAHRLTPSMTLRGAADLMLLGGQTSFPVVDDDALVGFLPHADLVRALRTHLLYAPVGELMRRDVLPASPGDEVFAVEQRMVAEQLDALPVVVGGRYAGLISLQQIDTLRRLASTAPRVAPPLRPSANASR